MTLSLDMTVQPIEEMTEGKYKFRLNGALNSADFIDSNQKALGKMSQLISEKLEMLQLTMESSEDDESNSQEPLPTRPHRISNRPIVTAETVASTPSAKPLDVPVRSGLVRAISERMAVVHEKKKVSEKSETSPPLNSVRKAENFHKYREAFQSSVVKKKPSAEQIERYRATQALQAAQAASLEQQIDSAEGASAKNSQARTTVVSPVIPKKVSQPVISRSSSSQSIAKSSSSQSISRGSSSGVERKEPAPVQHSIPSPEPEVYKPDIKSKIASFTPSKKKIQRVESDKSQPLVVLPPRRLKDSPFYRETTSHRKSEPVLEGIGKDELEARRQFFKKKRPEKKALDGTSDGLSKRNSSLFHEYKKKRPTMSNYVPGQASNSSTNDTAEDDEYIDEDEEYSMTDSAPSSPVESVASNLCLPRVTSTAYYYEIFEKNLAENTAIPPEIMDLVGKHYRSTCSHLERVVHLRHNLLGSMSTSEDRTESNHQQYTWNGQDTVDLIEKQFLKEGRIMYQTYQLSDNDRVFMCLPAAVAYSQATLSKINDYSPFKVSSVDSSLLMRTEDEINYLQDWAESEMSLSTWTGLRARFEDRTEVEFGISFSQGLEISDDMLAKHAAQIEAFLSLQFKKVLLDAKYTGYEGAVLALPPKRNIAKIAQKAISEVIEEMEYHLPQQFKIFYPAYEL